MKEKLKKELEEIQGRIFMVNMIDRWSSEDSRLYSELCRKEREIEQQLNLLRETELKVAVSCKVKELLNELGKGV